MAYGRVVILSYRDERTRDFARGKRVKAFFAIERAARLKLDRLEAATSVRDLVALSGNRFEALKGDRKGQSSIRINDQWRVCFEWPEKSPGPTNRITEILNGQRAITGDTALRLGHFFGTSPEFWLNLQSLYELRLAEQKKGKIIKALPTLQRLKGRHARQSAHAWRSPSPPGRSG